MLSTIYARWLNFFFFNSHPNEELHEKYYAGSRCFPKFQNCKEERDVPDFSGCPFLGKTGQREEVNLHSVRSFSLGHRFMVKYKTFENRSWSWKCWQILTGRRASRWHNNTKQGPQAQWRFGKEGRIVQRAPLANNQPGLNRCLCFAHTTVPLWPSKLSQFYFFISDWNMLQGVKDCNFSLHSWIYCFLSTMSDGPVNHTPQGGCWALQERLTEYKTPNLFRSLFVSFFSAYFNMHHM